MKFMKSGQKGFTLIELLVVIAILGTLAGVVVLNVIQFIGRGACEAAKTEYHNIQTACIAAEYENTASPGAGAVYTDYLQTTGKYDWSTVVTANVMAPNTYPADWPAVCTP